ncbi:MAG: PBP1A family penicillin-binding protein [Acidobacteriota bacterium]|nr:MAG: PBP1A family penicillin-binding protein [Acidobacteriota bacterium]
MSDDYFKTPRDEHGDGSESTMMDKLTEFGVRLKEFFRRSDLESLVVLAAVAGGLTGLMVINQLSFTSFAAEVDALADYRPAEITKVYAADGKTVIGELALERRIPLEYQEIPRTMREAILAIEDTRFYEHIGIDPVRVLGAVVQNVVRQRRAQGASTLTQQLARVLYLNREKTYIRKVKEVMYALQIERVYTKEQILTLYCNQIFMGGGAYGFEAASRFYFSKPLEDLSLEQYALLAALPKSHQQYSPLRRPKQATERRNLVLQAMADAGFISRAESEEAKGRPLGLKPDDQRGKNDRSPYAYFVEEVRQELQRILVDKHAQDAMDVYRSGLRVYTTLDHKAQLAAVEAVQKGARSYQRRHGWRVRFDNVLEEGDIALDDFEHPSWISAAPSVGDLVTGLILEVSDRGTRVSFGSFSAVITAEQTKIIGRPPSKLFRRGDLTQFRVRAVDLNRRVLTVDHEPEPDVQAALVLLDSRTGEIKAMVGGYDFATSKFNHATQALRQTGSVFKPFIYAAALEQGFRPDDIIDDAPFQQGSWVPHNYDNTFMGPISVRQAIALSRNIPAVRILDEIGVRNASDLVKRMRLPNPMSPFLSSALGATEEPLLDMVAAYSIFPNGGRRAEPIRIRKVLDRDGNVLEEAQPQPVRIVSEYVAAQMVDLMRGAVQFGTATAASSLGYEIAGKTGTVNDFTDAWFIGYTPSVACGVWIGYSDSKKSLGNNEAGSTAALPFWIDFMRDYLKGKPKEKFGRIPEAPADLINIQAQRSYRHAAERARLAALSGDILPGSVDVPDLDPLAGNAIRPETPAPVRTSPPPPNREEPAPVIRVDSNPKILRPPAESKPAKPAEPVRKGKKGKEEDPEK